MKIILATHNLNKLKEIKNMINNDNITIISLKDLEDHDDILENGNSYKQNALLKAKHFHAKYGIPVLADDSGLSISYLNGSPGIHSKRFSEGSDERGNEKVLHLLKNAKNRKALFICHLVFIDKGQEFHFKSYLKGSIAEFQEGKQGFGYDPIFIPDKETKTLASLGSEYKVNNSHRARSYKKFIKFLNNQL